MTEQNVKPRLRIDGTEYELPDDLTVRDLMWQYRYASHFGITGDPPAIAVSLGAMHVAISRAKPDLPAHEIEDKLLSIPVADLEAMILEAQAAVPDPPSGSSGGDEPSESGSSPGSEPRPEPSGLNHSGDLSSVSSAFDPVT